VCVCMCVSMYVCMYGCVCVYVWMCVCVCVCMCVCMDGCVCVCVCIDRWMCVCVCMYVCPLESEVPSPYQIDGNISLLCLSWADLSLLSSLLSRCIVVHVCLC